MSSEKSRMHVLRRGVKVGKFLAAGLPGIAVAIPLNLLLVKSLGWSPWLAYALVLLVQVSVNFFGCRWFVFQKTDTLSVWKQYFLFLNGILIFRIGDWGLYSLLVGVCHLPILPVQLGNVVIFALMKFRFSERLMEGQ
ncbi:MAG: GtrA family protein [Verrucomicrobia bacterium]|nr:GtrA family protein [Verrucomicrobiota bacterium]